MTQPVPSTPKSEPRYVELDALRGVAAFTVVLHHFRLMWFSLGPEPRWLKLTNPITSGYESVMLFFLLSGFVLSVPYLRGKGQPYPIYLLRRILRIYAPYLVALGLAVVGAAIWHDSLHLGGWADKTWSRPVSIPLVLAHIVMLGNYDWAQFNTAFWSLVVEMRISIIFPFLFLLVQKLHTAAAIALAFVLALGTGFVIAHYPDTADTLHTLQYTSIFVAGILLARNIQRVNAWYRGLNIAMVALLFVVSPLFYIWGHHLGEFVKIKAEPALVINTIGAVGLLILSLNAAPVRYFLTVPATRFLGRISYSLYLVHGPLLFAQTHLLGRCVSVPLQFVIFVPTSLIVAYLFCIAVEEPFLAVSRHVAKLAKPRRELVETAIPAGPIA